MNIQGVFIGPKHHAHTTAICYFYWICLIETMSQTVVFYVEFRLQKYANISKFRQPPVVSLPYGKGSCSAPFDFYSSKRHDL